jgi:nitrogen PTS system EIIA component
MNTQVDIFTAFAVAGDLFEKKLELSSSTVVHFLNTREDLSSTALGSGVAIPHATISGIDTPVASLIKLTEAIDFSAPDGIKISLLIFLLLPEKPVQGHIQILSSLAQLLLDNDQRQNLLAIHGPEKICQLLNLAIDVSETPQIQALYNDFKPSIAPSNQYILNYLAEWAILEVSRKKDGKIVSLIKG